MTQPEPDLVLPASKPTEEPPRFSLGDFEVDQPSRGLFMSLHETGHHLLTDRFVNLAEPPGGEGVEAFYAPRASAGSTGSYAALRSFQKSAAVVDESARRLLLSRVAVYFHERVAQAVGELTAAFGRRKVVSQLNALKDKASTPDWDGEGADPVAEGTFLLARTFVNQLPDDVADPDGVAATPDGEVEFSWEGDGGVFDLVVLPTGELAMSGIYGERAGSTDEGMNVYGTAKWDRQSLPGFVTSGLAWVGSPTRR